VECIIRMILYYVGLLARFHSGLYRYHCSIR